MKTTWAVLWATASDSSNLNLLTFPRMRVKVTFSLWSRLRAAFVSCNIVCGLARIRSCSMLSSALSTSAIHMSWFSTWRSIPPWEPDEACEACSARPRETTLRKKPTKGYSCILHACVRVRMIKLKHYRQLCVFSRFQYISTVQSFYLFQLFKSDKLR